MLQSIDYRCKSIRADKIRRCFSERVGISRMSPPSYLMQWLILYLQALYVRSVSDDIAARHAGVIKNNPDRLISCIMCFLNLRV